MDDSPQVWHYGLMAERWAEFLIDAPELPYFRRQIERHGEPVLDVACGAGRLLVPLLSSGVDADGTDISQDMLDRCRAKAASAGHYPGLYAQAMDELDLPRRYRTIYICSSFGLAGSRDRDLETLRRCHAHLQEGGALILNMDAEYTDADSWAQWLPERRRALPEPWPTDAPRKSAADGSEHVAFFRFVAVDPFRQTYTREVRLEKWQDHSLVRSEEYTLRGNMYLAQEVVLMLRVAGFREITAVGDWSDAPATANHETLVFIAVR